MPRGYEASFALSSVHLFVLKNYQVNKKACVYSEMSYRRCRCGQYEISLFVSEAGKFIDTAEQDGETETRREERRQQRRGQEEAEEGGRHRHGERSQRHQTATDEVLRRNSEATDDQRQKEKEGEKRCEETAASRDE